METHADWDFVMRDATEAVANEEESDCDASQPWGHLVVGWECRKVSLGPAGAD
jgi:hypothetical protein